jgi:ribosomal protein S12 methylthiotransferase
MDGRVPRELMDERLEELMEVQRGISFDANLALVGRRMTALVDERLPDDDDYAAVARTRGQALEVDGVTNLLRGVEVERGVEVAPGGMVDVEIVDALDYDLVAEIRG